MPAQDRTGLLRQALSERILVLDGAMGTALQAFDLTESDFRSTRFAESETALFGQNDLLTLTQPEIVREIHASYLAAGADIIETNTFGATSIALADYGLESIARELNRKAALLARGAADEAERRDSGRPRWVAGAIGPTNRTASISADVSDPGARTITFDDLRHAYAEQALALIDGGADLLLVETAFDTLNAKAALFAISEVLAERGTDLPVAVSGTITDLSGRTLSGQTAEAFYHSVSHGVQPGPGRSSGLLAIGFNCALGVTELRPHVRALAEVASVPVLCYPNAGLPDELGEYNDTPELMAEAMAELAAEGVLNIVGGCCGTTAEHVAAMAEAVRGVPPRRIAHPPRLTRLSGLEPFVVNPGGAFFVNVGERTNVTGSRKFARLVREESPEVVAVAREQVEGGAQVVDVNMDDALLDSATEMTRFLNLVAAEPDVARVPVMVDSSEWDVIEAGLKCLQGKGVINSISLKDGEELFRERARLARRYGAAVVVMAFDEEGQADSVDRRVAICERAYALLMEEDFPPEDVIFDPNVFAVATGIPEHDRYAVDFFEATRRIKASCPHALVSGGVSNVSFSFRGSPALREAMHSAFLRHGIEAGMDMAIVNAGALPIYDELPAELLEPVEDVLLARRPAATEQLVEIAQELRGAVRAADGRTPEWRGLPLEERISHALVHGIDGFIEGDVEEARQLLGVALAVIEGPLMAGMDRVGELFGSGRIFLPQVVKSARIMKKAVAELTPHLERERRESLDGGDAGRADEDAEGGGDLGRGRGGFGHKGRILLATVKGDVHDIGKNILAVVLRCNGYEVIDLGVMVPAERILETARQREVDIIGLSGLITPSLRQMMLFAREMERQELNLPLLIGGATTSRTHTALRIEPEYTLGPAVHVADASRAVGVVGALFDPKRRRDYVSNVRDEYDALRRRPGRKGRRPALLSIADARASGPKLDWTGYEPPVPPLPGVHTFSPSIAELSPYIDWGPFFATWELRGSFPGILDDPELGGQACELLEEAELLLENLEKDRRVRPRGVAGLFPAFSEGDDVLLDASGADGPVRVPFLRQQFRKQGRAASCLADFVAPANAGRDDWIGAFAVTSGGEIESLAAEASAAGDDFRSILVKAIGDRLAEAFAEHMHERVRTELWGYAANEELSADDLVAERYRGIRPAPGYPACPDHTQKELIFELLDAGNLGLRLTESCAMSPASSVAGWYFSHPEARYFGIGRVGRDQVRDYACRWDRPLAEVEEWLAPNLGYEPTAPEAVR